MFQVVTNAQWANHVGRPIVLKYPGLAAWRASPTHHDPDYVARMASPTFSSRHQLAPADILFVILCVKGFPQMREVGFLFRRLCAV